MSARIWSNLQKRSKIKAASAPKTEYRARPLSADDIQKMSGDELHWHSINNREALDAALKSEPTRSPQQREDARMTGSTSGASKEAGERKGWDATKVLTYADIQKMTADESLWQSRFNPSWKAAFDEEERRRQSKRHVAKTRIELCYAGHATEEEDGAAIRAGNDFALRTPTFPRTLEAATLIRDFMKDKLLDGTRVDSYTKAFRELVEQGRIEPLPYQTADEFRKSTSALQETRTPPMIQAREAKAQATAEVFSKAAENTVQSGSTKFTDYPERERIGYGNHTRYSFRKLLESLSAEEYKQRLIEDKSFSDAVDKIQNSNR